jgi:hypothetical protein
MTNITQQELQDAPDHWNQGLNKFVKSFLTDLNHNNPSEHKVIQDLDLKLKISETHTELEPLMLIPIYDYQNNKNSLTILFNTFELKVDNYLVASAAIAFFGSTSMNFTRY